MVALVGAVACAIAPASAQAPVAPYGRDARVAHLERALTTLQTLGPDGTRAFETALYQAVRVRCAPSGSKPPAVACLRQVSAATCGARPDPAGCAAAADVLLTNLHAEIALVPEATRMRLVRAGSDYHGAMLAEVRTRQALLAAELTLATPGAPADGARIDRFCAGRDRTARACEPGATLCVGSQPWQRCAAMLIWYVATTGSPPTGGRR